MKPYYQDKYATIYHGDCLELLPEMPEVDLVLTDPPYGITANHWDAEYDVQLFWNKLPTNNAIIFASFQLAAKLVYLNIKDFKYDLVWHKTQSTNHLNCKVMPLRNHENILVFGDVDYVPVLSKKHADFRRPFTGNTGVNNGTYGKFEAYRDAQRTIGLNESYPKTVIIEDNVNRGEYLNHPTQKPLRLIKTILCLYKCKTILDPFGGSCTTAVAAKQLNRKCIIIEIEEKYCEIGAKRLSQEVLDLST